MNKLTTLELQKLYKKLLSKGRVDRVEAKGQPKGLSHKMMWNIHQIISSAMDFARNQKLIAVAAPTSPFTHRRADLPGQRSPDSRMGQVMGQ